MEQRSEADPFHAQLLDRIGGDAASVDRETRKRLGLFAKLSPLYRDLLLKRPEDLLWLLQAPIADDGQRTQSIANEWRRTLAASGIASNSPECLSLLRLFRRRMSMRIAYWDVFSLQDNRQTTLDLSMLAELCARECYQFALKQWGKRYGEPWDEDLDRAARFCVLALGKLGGLELNFSSDIDLIYFYEGEGCCRLEGKTLAFTTAQFFTKVAETLTNLLQEQTEHGFLFRVDLRLRPEGARSPLIRSFAGMENYYAAAGQTWERLAFIKARPVAGDLALGGELLESLHSFRYPRHPPPSLLSEIASMKARTEKEVVGSANLKRNVKSGYGGIREIEFVTQTMQLLHGGRNPFLQTHATEEGLTQLVKYQLMDSRDASFLKDAYRFLRAVEHRLQIREEQRTHILPPSGPALDAIAESFGFDRADDFMARLNDTQEGVRARYTQLLKLSPVDEEMADWWMFFSERKATSAVEAAMARWFGEPEAAAGHLLDFVQGSRNFLLTREHVTRFVGLVKIFDRIMPKLAFPLRAMQRVSRFASFYGSRGQFLSACSLDHGFFDLLALLFDRSEFIHELLCQNPEILDEVLRPEILRRRKTVETTVRELTRCAPKENFEEWLWLYVKAEQVRIAIGELLDFVSIEEGEANLSALADAVFQFALQRFDPEQRLLLVALGKYGGSELTFGSDLDALFVGSGQDPQTDERIVRHIVQVFTHRAALGPIYQIDLRLRPHGKDGPLTPTIPAMNRYHARHAQAWEKQALTRARVICGNERLAKEWDELVLRLIYREPITREELRELWEMRLRVERERDHTDPPQRAFKTGPGGLIDIEFFVQFCQLKHGWRDQALRATGTRQALENIARAGLIDADEAEALRKNHAFLKRLEALLRRDKNAAISVIGESKEEQHAIARWSGFRDYGEFWREHIRRATATRSIIGKKVEEMMHGE